jgi:hypothetical protein
VTRKWAGKEPTRTVEARHTNTPQPAFLFRVRPRAAPIFQPAAASPIRGQRHSVLRLRPGDLTRQKPASTSPGDHAGIAREGSQQRFVTIQRDDFTVDERVTLKTFGRPGRSVEIDLLMSSWISSLRPSKVTALACSSTSIAAVDPVSWILNQKASLHGSLLSVAGSRNI